VAQRDAVAVAGYSGTPLQQKLGLATGDRVAFVGAVPARFADQFEGVKVRSAVRGSLEAVVLFVEWRRDLGKRFPAAAAAIAPDGKLWVAWPKKASKRPTDITEDVLREVLLPTGLVDVKVCAVDDVWSGLKFVWRKELRAALSH
jgi:hypothetical protein